MDNAIQMASEPLPDQGSRFVVDETAPSGPICVALYVDADNQSPQTASALVDLLCAGLGARILHATIAGNSDGKREAVAGDDRSSSHGHRRLQCSGSGQAGLQRCLREPEQKRHHRRAHAQGGRVRPASPKARRGDRSDAWPSLERARLTEDWLREQAPEISLLPVPDTPAALRSVARGDAFAFVGNLATTSYSIGASGLTEINVLVLPRRWRGSPRARRPAGAST